MVISHASRPQLRLTTQQAADLVARRGAPGVARSVRAVERDPAAVGVVPLSEVGPTVVAATVAGVDPVRDREGATTLVVTGDVMLVRGVPDPAAALAPMRRLLRGADLTVGNLESTLSTDGEPQQPGNDSFGGSPALVPVLEDAGFDALSLANNHTGDYGERALRQTVETLQQSRIRPFGAGDDVAEAAEPAVLSAPDGTTYAFLGFNAIGETPRATDGEPGRAVGADAAAHRPAGRGRPGPRRAGGPAAQRARRRGRRAAALGDAVHPRPRAGPAHRRPAAGRGRRRPGRGRSPALGAGRRRGRRGAGAALARQLRLRHGLHDETMEGVLLEATFWGAELKAVRLVPYRMDDGSFAPRRLRGADVLADVWSASTGPFASLILGRPG